MLNPLEKIPALICFFFVDHNWYSPDWLSKVSIENPKGENRRQCRRCGKIETIPYYPTIKEQMQRRRS